MTKGIWKFMPKIYKTRNLIISVILIVMSVAFTSCSRKGTDNLTNHLSDNYFTIKANFPTDRFSMRIFKESSFECTMQFDFIKQYYFYKYHEDKKIFEFRYLHYGRVFILMVKKFGENDYRAFYIWWLYNGSEYKMFKNESNLVSNVDESMVKQLFPSFRGKVTQETYNEVNLNFFFLDPGVPNFYNKFK